MSDHRKTIKGPGYTKYIQTDHPLGYVVMGASRGGPAMVWPIFRGDSVIKTTERGKQVNLWLSTYEQGQPLNGRSFPEDYEGCVLASIAAQAIQALQNRHDAAKARRPRKKAR